jgi:hypothetical protein
MYMQNMTDFTVLSLKMNPFNSRTQVSEISAWFIMLLYKKHLVLWVTVKILSLGNTVMPWGNSIFTVNYETVQNF